jgi:hypothetical protein
MMALEVDQYGYLCLGTENEGRWFSLSEVEAVGN